MKSTNRQYHFKLNSAKNYLKMCLLNWILISMVTLTHSLPIPTTLNSAIEKYPKYRDTLLNPATVPFVTDCLTGNLKGTQKILCGSYFEMIEKLNHSNVEGLATGEDFIKAMDVYNQTKIDEFCGKFPDYVPNDANAYPISNILYERLHGNYCPVFCLDGDIDVGMVKAICRVCAIGFQLSNVEVPVQLINPVANSTINQPSAEGSRNSGMVQPDISSNSEPMSGSVKLEKDKPSVVIPISANAAAAAIKQVVETVPNAKVDEVDEKANEEKNDGVDEKPVNENSANAEAASEASQNVKIREGDAKSLDATNIKSNQTPTVKQEQNPTLKELNPSENPMPNSETAEKPAVNEEQPLDPEIDEEPAKEDEDKTGYKVVTEDNDIFEDTDAKDKINMSDDSLENGEDEEPIDSQVAQSAKLPPVQSPSNEQLHNEEDPFTDDTDSNFFTYFMFLLLVCVIAYVVYHNKSKMLALMLEGRRSNTSGRSGLSRRKHTAAYRKLDSNLEEAITSSGNGRSTQVIY